MNISYRWLQELIDIDLPADELAEALTRVGLAVEGIHSVGDDSGFDIDLTSNRPDCLSHLGVAREAAVITGGRLKREVTQDRAEMPEAPYPAVLAPDIVKIEDADLCHRFTAHIIRGVKIGPSPEWLRIRLEAIGERPINNVADITNYVMHELGQPMHAFDLDKLAENRIVVRRAKPGEAITTLDEAERKIDVSMLMICDAEKPVAIGGIMGGLESSITDETVNVLLEVAYFDRESIRKTSRKLGLATEASYRFERGVDVEKLTDASNRAAELICELAGGEAEEIVDVYPNRFTAREIVSRDISSAVARLTGLEVAPDECVRILAALGIAEKRGADPDGSSARTFVSPSWRHDISIEEDLVEEVARHAGYEKIRDELPPAFSAGEYQPAEMRRKVLRQTLADLAFDEAITYSFIEAGFDDRYQTVPGLLDKNVEAKFVTLRDSVIEGAVRMRPTLLPGLLDSVRLNFNHQRRDLRLFEIGKVFAAKRSEDGLPNERELLAFAVTGGDLMEGRSTSVRELDFYDAKGALEAGLNAIGFANADLSAIDIKHLRPGQSAAVSVRNGVVGYMGRLNEEIAADYKFKQPVYVAEIDLQALLEATPEPVRYTPLPKYPAVVRDVSFLVERDVTFGSIRDAILSQQIELCRRVSFVDVFEGKGMAENQRSITIRLEYRSDERTLVDDEVSDVHAQLLRSVEAALGIKPRT